MVKLRDKGRRVICMKKWKRNGQKGREGGREKEGRVMFLLQSVIGIVLGRGERNCSTVT